MTMDRWNSINPLVESVAGRLARAHLNNELHQLKSAAGNRTQEAVHNHAVTVMARYVGALYGINISDVLSLSMRDVDGWNVEPGSEKREPMPPSVDDVERGLGSHDPFNVLRAARESQAKKEGKS